MNWFSAPISLTEFCLIAIVFLLVSIAERKSPEEKRIEECKRQQDMLERGLDPDTGKPFKGCLE